MRHTLTKCEKAAYALGTDDTVTHFDNLRIFLPARTYITPFVPPVLLNDIIPDNPRRDGYINKTETLTKEVWSLNVPSELPQGLVKLL